MNIYKVRFLLLIFLLQLSVSTWSKENLSCVDRTLNYLVGNTTNIVRTTQQVAQGYRRPFFYRNTLVGQLGKNKAIKSEITGRLKINKNKELIRDNEGRTYLIERSPRSMYARVWDSEQKKFILHEVDPNTNKLKLEDMHENIFHTPTGKHEKSDELGKVLYSMTRSFGGNGVDKAVNKLLENESLRAELRKGMSLGPWDPKKNVFLVKDGDKEVLVLRDVYSARIAVTDEVGNRVSLSEKEYLALIKPIDKANETRELQNQDALIVYERFQQEVRLNEGAQELKSSIRSGALSMTFYPTVAPFRVLGTVVESAATNGLRSFYRTPIDIVRSEAVVASGFAGMYYTNSNPFYYLLLNTTGIRDDEFHEKTVAEDPSGISVFVDGIPDDDTLWGYGKHYYETRFSTSLTGKKFYIRPKSLYDLKYELIRIRNEHGKIKNIEILGHGLPGSMDINGSKLTKHSAQRYLYMNDVFDSDAEIKVVSCLVGDKSFTGDSGGKMMQSLGNSMLDNGGKVYAATEVIWVPNTSFPKEVRINEKTLLEKYQKMALFPLEAVVLYGMKFDGINDGLVREEQIPDRSR